MAATYPKPSNSVILLFMGSKFRSAALLVGLLAMTGCARHALPDLEFLDEQLGETPGGDGDMEMPDPMPPEDMPPEGGDGDEPQIQPDASLPPPTPDSGPGPDPNDRTPAPTNVEGCPDEAPKPPFALAPCGLSEAVICKYGTSYDCYCGVAGWVCPN